MTNSGARSKVEDEEEIDAMVNNFPMFADLVAARFHELCEAPFSAGVDGDELYALYLAAFPAGSNPTFKNRTEHDCSCCKHFIRRVGALVGFDESTLTVKTVWDAASERAPYPYAQVASRLRERVLAAPVVDLWRVSNKEGQIGSKSTVSQDKETLRALSWNHLYTGAIPRNLRSSTLGETLGAYRTTVQVFRRGLVELLEEAVGTVLSLIEANNLYRGEEHKTAVLAFRDAQRLYASLSLQGKDAFVWSRATGPAARFRNTVIGTLVQDISEGRDVEQAVRSFESKVAPTNYKRTTAVITPGMVKKAMETIEQLGLEPALERRFAVVGDVSVNDVKWVDGSVKPLMKGGIGEALMQHAVASNPKSAEDDEARAEEIGIDQFVDRVLPEMTSMEVLFRGEHVGNLMSLTAPVHPEPRQLFRWSNDFAWSYGGNVADSIKERVKKAGGKVEGALLRVSLSWFNYDDLDLHIIQPPGRGAHAMSERICYRSKQGWTGGVLDVDMNAGVGRTREAVENVVWSSRIPDGVYRVQVHNFTQRETNDPGFVVEVEHGGKLSHFSYNKMVQNGGLVEVAALAIKDGVVASVEPGDPAISCANVSQDKWGLRTEQYVKVNMVTLSPNYWGANAVGNKHTFFILDGARNDEAARGIYNEFLHPRLEPHRRVFEVIGEKTKCRPTEGQLSGLGFSSTKRDSFIVRTRQGHRQRIFRVKVGS